MRSAATVALEFDSAKLLYFPTLRIIPENPDVTNGFDMSPYTPPWYILTLHTFFAERNLHLEFHTYCTIKL